MRGTVVRTPAILWLAAVLASGTAVAAPTQPTDAPADRPEAKAAVAAQEDEYKVVCKRVASTGSFLSADKTCRKVLKRKRSATSGAN